MQMNWVKGITTLTLALALTGCGTDAYRRAWVDPSTVPDKEKYALDMDECRAVAMAAFEARQASDRGSALATVGAGTVGAVGGEVIARAVGGNLLFGGVAGAVFGAESQGGSSRDRLGVLYDTNRSCLQGRGYQTLQ